MKVEKYSITNPYIDWKDEILFNLDKGTIRNDSKHKATCLKNKKKRKKRRKN